MKTMPYQKYQPCPSVDLADRTWPSKTIAKAPAWCSVDLRDGNQALAVPMSVSEKLEMFNLLVAMGFKEIEVGFPSASQVEFDFLRLLIEGNHAPGDVTIQILTQAREHLIKKTLESLQGAKRAIIHLYNSTSELQRRVVFRMNKVEIMELAVSGAQMIREEAFKLAGTDIMFEYSPESFTGTEPEFALEICEAVAAVWQPATRNKIIFNLPATVEMATPNVYADRIEWFCRNVSDRGKRIISVHAHNDRGTAVAATELALLAGADRVEGTLFGNGERTGNVDVLTLAMNLFSQGIDPKLDMSYMEKIADIYERCTRMPVHPRHPYAGELVYTAFSGSHQDAINKGMKACRASEQTCWEVPYLPIDPRDVGRTFEGVIRINSQSGKGGVAYIMEKEFGLILPRDMQPEFSSLIQALSETAGREVTSGKLLSAFEREYLMKEDPLAFKTCRIEELPALPYDSTAKTDVRALITVIGAEREVRGIGNGPLDAFCKALKDFLAVDFTLMAYQEHALGQGSDSKAAAYVQIRDDAGARIFGAGVDTNIAIASLKAIVSALNRSPQTIRQLGGASLRAGEYSGE